MQTRHAQVLIIMLMGCVAARPAGITPAEFPPLQVTGSQDQEKSKVAGKPPDPVVKLLVEAHNAKRADAGLAPLTLDPLLCEAALTHAESMAKTGILEHEGPEDGSTFAERIERTGYKHRAAGENIASGAKTVPDVMDDWMNSPGHKKNIMGDFEQMGAARVKDTEGRWFWAVEFATPWPSVDAKSAPEEVVRLLNLRRKAEGLGTLRSDSGIQSIAEGMAKDLAANGGTKSFNSSVAFDRLKQKNIRFKKATVSISVGHGTPKELLDGLSQQAGSESDLFGDFTRIGVGAASTVDGIPCWFLLLAQ
jgi:uncharacterized protein YkwD